MNSYLRSTTAAVAAAATAIAFAQAPETPAKPTGVEQPVQFAAAPIATLSTGAHGANAEVANAIVQALAADASLKGSKLTVVPEEHHVLVTGVTPTLRQLAEAVNIATQHAGEGNVVSAISTEQSFIEPMSITLNPFGSQTS